MSVLKVVIQSSLSIKISSLLALPSGATAFETLKNIFTKKNPDYVEAVKWGRSVFGIDAYIYSYNVLGDEIKIDRGGIEKVKAHLEKFKIEIEWVDYTLVLPQIKIIRNAKHALREDQKTALKEMHKTLKTLVIPQGIFLADTSFGKTFSFVYYANEIGQPLLILVHTKFMQKQWIEELVNNFGLNPSDIGGAGGKFKKPVVKNVNVALYHSMGKQEINLLFREKIGFLLVDEVQKVAISQFRSAVKPFRARYRLGCSAGIDRRDGKKFVVTDLIGEVVHEAKMAEDANSKIFANIFSTKTGWGPLEAEENQAIISEASRDEQRNIKIAKSAVRQHKLGKIVIIFVERKEQAGVLAKILSKFRVHLLIGDVPPKEIEAMDIPQKAKKFLLDNDPDKALDLVKGLALLKELDFIIATQKAEVGLSIETLGHAIVTTPVGKNLERFHQLLGRIERKHKDERLEMFGEKEVPTCEIMVDNWVSSIEAWTMIKEKYKKRIIKNPFIKK